MGVSASNQTDVKFHDLNDHFMNRFNEGERDENGEYVDGGIGVFAKGEYFEVVEWDDFMKELKTLLSEKGAKTGDFVFVPYGDRIESCFGVVLENFEVSFGEYGWSAPYECNKGVNILKEHNVKYKDFYTKMRKNKNHGEFFFMWETETMVDEMKEAGVWD